MVTDSQFESLYNDYKNLVYNLALHYTQNPPDAEDVTQDVFVKVFQRYHTFNPAAASLKTWMYRIAINQCLDHIKARKTKKRFGFITSLFHAGSGEPLQDVAQFNHPGVAAEHKEETALLFRAINRLPVNQRTAVILLKIEGRSQKEVAEIMNLGIKAVESLLQRARQNLLKTLANTKDGRLFIV